MSTFKVSLHYLFLVVLSVLPSLPSSNTAFCAQSAGIGLYIPGLSFSYTPADITFRVAQHQHLAGRSFFGQVSHATGSPNLS